MSREIRLAPLAVGDGGVYAYTIATVVSAIVNLSTAWEIELSLLPASTFIDDRGTVLVVRSEEYPNHIWKNFILVDKLPQRDFCADLVRMFRAEFPQREFSIAFGWNQPPLTRRYIADFRRHGFTVNRDLVLFTDPAGIPPAPERLMNLRECKSSADWDVVVQRRIEILCDEPFKELKTRFEADKFRIYRDLVEAKRGHWFISSTEDQDLADVGVFYSRGNWASIEELLVYPAVRRRGWGVATIQASCHAALATRVPEGFVTVADEDRFARRLCATLGFSRTGSIERSFWHRFMSRATP